MSRRIETPAPASGRRLLTSLTEDYDAKPPVFSLERLVDGDYCLSGLTAGEQADFANAIFKRRKITWKELKSVHRHRLGFEKIEKAAIKTRLPQCITEDAATLLAFRFSAKKPMVGYRVQNIFYVLWFDSKFKLYSH